VPDVLFVCTGNRCRSPVAEALTVRTLRSRGVQASTASAGLLEGGALLPPETVRVLQRYGIDGRRRTSRQVSAELVGASALVLGMDRSHVREVSVLDASAWHRTFTLKELVRRASIAGARPHGEPVARWAERVAAGRDPMDLLGASDDDDIADPMGEPYPEHVRTATVIDQLVGRFVPLVWPT
jgi:protein-tyrosine phosphatase